MFNLVSLYAYLTFYVRVWGKLLKNVNVKTFHARNNLTLKAVLENVLMLKQFSMHKVTGKNPWTICACLENKTTSINQKVITLR